MLMGNIANRKIQNYHNLTAVNHIRIYAPVNKTNDTIPSLHFFTVYLKAPAQARHILLYFIDSSFFNLHPFVNGVNHANHTQQTKSEAD